MELIDIIEYCILLGGLYYIYNISTTYLSLKHRRDFFANNRIIFILAFIGSIGMILNFQTFWLTNYFENHRYIELFVKIALALFSLVNQFLVYELDEEKHNSRRKRGSSSSTYYSNGGKLSFQLLNRLFLLIIVYKFFNRNS